jgi:hypothetical protein
MIQERGVISDAEARVEARMFSFAGLVFKKAIKHFGGILFWEQQ